MRETGPASVPFAHSDGRTCLSQSVFHFSSALAGAYQLSVNPSHWAILCSPRLNKEPMIISSPSSCMQLRGMKWAVLLAGTLSQGVVKEKCWRTTPLDLILGKLSLRKPCWLLLETPQNTNVFKIRAVLINCLQGNVVHKITGPKWCHTKQDEYQQRTNKTRFIYCEARNQVNHWIP